MPSHYDTLGIQQQASLDVIKKPYRALQLQYHPDKIGNLLEEKREEGARISQQGNIAYETLSDAELRAAYDSTLPPPPKRTRFDYGPRTYFDPTKYPAAPSDILHLCTNQWDDLTSRDQQHHQQQHAHNIRIVLKHVQVLSTSTKGAGTLLSPSTGPTSPAIGASQCQTSTLMNSKCSSSCRSASAHRTRQAIRTCVSQSNARLRIVVSIRSIPFTDIA